VKITQPIAKDKRVSEAFKIGETVTFGRYGWYHQGINIAKIERETKKQYVLDNNRRYWKETLREVGESGYIEKFTDEKKEKYKLQKTLSEISARISSLDNIRRHIQNKNLKELGVVISYLDSVEKILKQNTTNSKG